MILRINLNKVKLLASSGFHLPVSRHRLQYRCESESSEFDMHPTFSTPETSLRPAFAAAFGAFRAVASVSVHVYVVIARVAAARVAAAAAVDT